MSEPHYPRGKHPNTVAARHRPWQPGESGNPSGGRKGMGLIKAIEAELRQPLDPDDHAGVTTLEGIARRLVGIALDGEDKDSIAAIKVLLLYLEGPPEQHIRLETTALARRIANEVGCDPTWLLQEAERIAASLGGDDEG